MDSQSPSQERSQGRGAGAAAAGGGEAGKKKEEKLSEEDALKVLERAKRKHELVNQRGTVREARTRKLVSVCSRRSVLLSVALVCRRKDFFPSKLHASFARMHGQSLFPRFSVCTALSGLSHTRCCCFTSRPVANTPAQLYIPYPSQYQKRVQAAEEISGGGADKNAGTAQAQAPQPAPARVRKLPASLGGRPGGDAQSSSGQHDMILPRSSRAPAAPVPPPSVPPRSGSASLEHPTTLTPLQQSRSTAPQEEAVVDAPRALSNATPPSRPSAAPQLTPSPWLSRPHGHKRRPPDSGAHASGSRERRRSPVVEPVPAPVRHTGVDSLDTSPMSSPEPQRRRQVRPRARPRDTHRPSIEVQDSADSPSGSPVAGSRAVSHTAAQQGRQQGQCSDSMDVDAAGTLQSQQPPPLAGSLSQSANPAAGSYALPVALPGAADNNNSGCTLPFALPVSGDSVPVGEVATPAPAASPTSSPPVGDAPCAQSQSRKISIMQLSDDILGMRHMQRCHL